MRPLRVAIIGRMPENEVVEWSRIPRAFEDLGLKMREHLDPWAYEKPADLSGTRMASIDLVYLAQPFDVKELLEAWKEKYDAICRGFFGTFYREVNKRLARRLDGELCVPCRVLRGELKPSTVEHHVIYGEIVDDCFTNLMTVCDSIPRGEAVCHGYLHRHKVDHALEVLEGLAAKAERPADFRWQRALDYYRARRMGS